MRKDIHPEYQECTVRCSCGNTFTTRSTKSELRVELCNECHPFYTGQQKFVDTGGRVQRFSDKFGGAAQAALEKEKEAKAKRQEELKAQEEAKKSEREKKAQEKAARAKKYEEEAAKNPVKEEEVAEETTEEAPAEEAPATEE